MLVHRKLNSHCKTSTLEFVSLVQIHLLTDNLTTNSAIAIASPVVHLWCESQRHDVLRSLNGFETT